MTNVDENIPLPLLVDENIPLPLLENVLYEREIRRTIC